MESAGHQRSLILSHLEHPDLCVLYYPFTTKDGYIGFCMWLLGTKPWQLPCVDTNTDFVSSRSNQVITPYNYRNPDSPKKQRQRQTEERKIPRGDNLSVIGSTTTGKMDFISPKLSSPLGSRLSAEMPVTWQYMAVYQAHSRYKI